MNITYTNNKQYLKDRLRNINLISACEVDAIVSVLNYNATKSFALLRIDQYTINLYIANEYDKQLSITQIIEYIPHSLSSIYSDYSRDIKISKWWNSVFYNDGNKFNYDTKYDTLPIAEGNDTLFGDLNKSTKDILEADELKESLQEIKGMPIFVSSQAYSYCAPIFYNLQTLCQSSALTLINATSVDYSKITFLGSHLDYKLNISNQIVKASDYSNKEFTLQLPLDNNTLDSIAIGSLQWKELACNLENWDYEIYNIRIKNISISFKYDIYGNIFIKSSDLHENSVVLLLHKGNVNIKTFNQEHEEEIHEQNVIYEEVIIEQPTDDFLTEVEAHENETSENTTSENEISNSKVTEEEEKTIENKVNEEETIYNIVNEEETVKTTPYNDESSPITPPQQVVNDFNERQVHTIEKPKKSFNINRLRLCRWDQLSTLSEKELKKTKSIIEDSIAQFDYIYTDTNIWITPNVPKNNEAINMYYQRLLDKVTDIMKKYGGMHCVESFVFEEIQLFRKGFNDRRKVKIEDLKSIRGMSKGDSEDLLNNYKTKLQVIARKANSYISRKISENHSCAKHYFSIPHLQSENALKNVDNRGDLADKQIIDSIAESYKKGNKILLLTLDKEMITRCTGVINAMAVNDNGEQNPDMPSSTNVQICTDVKLLKNRIDYIYKIDKMLKSKNNGKS